MSEATRTAGLALIFSIIFVSLLMDWAKNCPEETDQGEEAEYPTGDAERDKSILKRSEITKNRADQKYRRYEILYWCGISLFTLLAAAGACISVVLASEALEASRDQAAAAQDQLTAMGEEQRPWIKVTLQASDIHWFYFTKNNLAGDMQPQIIVKNIGKSPALSVNAVARSYFPGDDTVDEAQKKACAFATALGNAPNHYGKILFPDDQTDASKQGIGTNGFGIFPDRIAKAQIPDGTGHSVFFFQIIGCADYIYGSPSRHHQTYFSYVVGRIIRRQRPLLDNWSGFSVGENVSAADIYMYEDGIQNYAN